MTEDLFLGYLIRSQGVQIHFHPYMELINSPQTILSNFKQRFIWSWGPMMYPYYFYYYFRNFKIKRKINISRAFILCLQGVYSYLSWILSGVMVLTLVVAPVFMKRYDLYLYSALPIFIYGFLQYYITLSLYPKLIEISAGKKEEKLLFREKFVIGIFSYIPIVLHSLAGLYGLFRQSTKMFFRIPIQKYKTDD